MQKHHISPHKDISQRGNDPESYHNSLYTYKVPIHEEDIYKPIIYLHKSPRLTLGIFAKRLLKKLHTDYYKENERENKYYNPHI